MRPRQLLVAACTFSVALGIGFIMQNGDALAARMAEPQAPDGGLDVPLIGPDRPVTADALRVPVVEGVPPQRMAASPLAIFAVVGPVRNAVDAAQGFAVAALLDDTILPEVGAPEVALACPVTLSATPQPPALVDLALAAPCSPNASVTLHHQGLMISARTDATGALRITLPALAADAVFLADVAESDGAVAVVSVPDLAAFDRAVVMWQGSEGPALHVREFGATYGAPGHVWSGAAGTVDQALQGAGGFILRLGDPAVAEPHMAEVYTYPTGLSRQAGEVVMTVEAEVTAANCGRDLMAQSVQILSGAEPEVQDLTMTLPGCDAVGDFVVVAGMLDPIAIAAAD